MTQATVNNAKVLYRLSAKREDVERAEKLFFLTPELQKTLENPMVPNTKKYEIIDRVFALEDLPDVIIKFVKTMCRIGYCDEMQNIFKAFYQYWDKENHIIRAEFISAGEPVDEEVEEAERLLQSKYPEEKIELTKKVDESLLGGYIVRISHEEYDRSYEGRLRQLERKLTGR